MKSINNYDNYYIMDDGRVYSSNRNKYLVPDIGPKGYSRVTLCKDGKTKKHLVHRLVADHYIPNPRVLEFVNHIDNDPTNNHFSNLEWCTHSENMIHSHKQGRCSNLIASEKASQLNQIKMTKHFSELLGGNFIKHRTENNRGLVSYHCNQCNKVHETRTDSSLLKKGGICNSCSRKKKI